MRRKDKKNLTINVKLKLFGYGMLIPFLILIAYLLYSMVTFCNSYNQIVKNITEANSYNLDFKEDLDYVMYRMIAGAVRAEDITQKAGLKNPHDIVEEARQEFESLDGITTGVGNERRIRIILRYFDNLDKYIEEINDTVNRSGHYDENMVRLDNNIHILTELTQEQIQEYIYYEAANLETVRQGLELQEKRAVQISVVLLAAIGVITGIFMTTMSRNISSPLEKLCRTAEIVGKGDFSTRAEEGQEGDEIFTLTNSFNSMIKRIGSLVDNIRMEQLNLRVTELKLLQAQINPHFLYNTLDTIIWLAEDNKKDEVVSMVTSLSDFFRTTLSEGRDFITMEEEQSHIRSYLEIQQFRYRDILEYEINIPEELYGCSIIKLTLQPLVENALYHGIKNKRGKGKITVSARKTGDNICLSVEDNGIGMKPEELENLRERVRNKGENGKGSFGLTNVEERLRLNYGPEYGLEFSSEYGKGTVVHVLIPAGEYEEVSIE